jgi:hypothetical protein
MIAPGPNRRAGESADFGAPPAFGRAAPAAGAVRGVGDGFVDVGGFGFGFFVWRNRRVGGIGARGRRPV